MKIVAKTCETCCSSFDAPAKEVARGSGRFCSLSCSSRRPRPAQRARVARTCGWCNAAVERKPSALAKSKHGLYFCSREHKEAAQSIDGGVSPIQPPHYNNGITNYRTRALRVSQACVTCGYAADVRMLDVDHIDSNRKNNALANLQVLCVWCHALKTRGVPTHPRV